MKKIFSVFVVLIILCISSINVSAKTLYALDGRQIEVAEETAKSWCNVGWYEYQRFYDKWICRNQRDYE